MKKPPALAIIIGIVVVVLLWVWSGYNGLITAEEDVRTAWSQVEGQYQRRVDLIPNLVSTVKGAADFEQETFQAVTEARSRWQDVQGSGDLSAQIGAAQGFDSALARLLVTVEAYPQLQATQAFRDLMAQLEGTENRIATARRDFNLAVRQYNLKTKRFPGNVLAGMFGFSERPFFEAEQGAEEAPDIEF